MDPCFHHPPNQSFLVFLRSLFLSTLGHWLKLTIPGSQQMFVEIAVDTMYIKLFVGRCVLPQIAAELNEVRGLPNCPDKDPHGHLLCWQVGQCLPRSASEFGSLIPVVASASACLSSWESLPNVVPRERGSTCSCPPPRAGRLFSRAFFVTARFGNQNPCFVVGART